jgi:transposase-like protein
MFSTEEKAKLSAVVNEGLQVLVEVETLNGGLNDTIKAIAEELDVKPALLKKAIKIAHKSSFSQTQEDNELVEQILTTVGRTL